MTDNEIKQTILDHLYWDMRVDDGDITVNVENGNVTLTGSVPTYFGKQSAYEDAWVIPGVVNVEDKLSIEYPATVKYPSDEQIRQSVESIILWSPDIDSTDINVKVDSGSVELSGIVDALWKKIKIKELISNLIGVIEIINKITIVSSDSIEDRKIAEDVIDALDRNINLDIDMVDVSVDNGVVTLSGEVTGWFEKAEVYNSALYTKGVKEIDDQISVYKE